MAAVNLQPVAGSMGVAPVGYISNTVSTFVTGVSGKTTRLYSAVLMASAATSVTVGTSTTALIGPVVLAAGTPMVLPFSGMPWAECVKGQDLTLTSSAAVQVGGVLQYTQV